MLRASCSLTGAASWPANPPLPADWFGVVSVPEPSSTEPTFTASGFGFAAAALGFAGAGVVETDWSPATGAAASAFGVAPGRAVAFDVALFGSAASVEAAGAGRPAAMAAIGSAARAGDASAASRDPSGRTDTVLTRFGSGKPLFVVETLVAGGGGTGTEAAPCVVVETDPSFGPP